MKRPDIATITFHKRVPRATPLVIVTPDAARQILIAAGSSDAEGLALRIAASREADGSLDYAMGFDNVRKGDIALTSEGIELVVAEEHRELLGGNDARFRRVRAGRFPVHLHQSERRRGAPAPPGSGGDA